MPWHVGASGVHKSVSGVWVGAGGVWKKASQAWVGAAGAWKASLDRVFIQALSFTRIGTPGSVRFDADGWVYANPGIGGSMVAQYQWLKGGAAGDYQIRSTADVSFPFSTDPSAGAWIGLGTSRTWSRTAGASQTRIAKGNFEIRDAVTNEVLTASVLIQIEADNTGGA